MVHSPARWCKTLLILSIAWFVLAASSASATRADEITRWADLTDFNADGNVDVLDVHRARGGADLPLERSRRKTESIIFESSSVSLTPGDTTGVLVKILDNTVPLFGYSLEIEVVADTSAVGTVGIDLAGTDLYPSQNLIIAGGAPLDSTFSVIEPRSDGAFVSANTDDLSTVTATEDVNDVLVRLSVYASSDVTGDFTLQLGPASVLSDGSGQPVPFTAGTYAFQVPTSVEPLPRRIARLGKPYPNPFNPRLTIPVELDEAEAITVDVYDLRGRHVAGLLDDVLVPGRSVVTWDGSDVSGRAVSSGTYLVRLRGAHRTEHARVTLVR